MHFKGVELNVVPLYHGHMENIHDNTTANRDPQPNYNRGEDNNETIQDILKECEHALKMGDKDSLLDAVFLIAYLCRKTETDEV